MKKTRINIASASMLRPNHILVLTALHVGWDDQRQQTIIANSAKCSMRRRAAEMPVRNGVS